MKRNSRHTAIRYILNASPEGQPGTATGSDDNAAEPATDAEGTTKPRSRSGRRGSRSTKRKADNVEKLALDDADDSSADRDAEAAA